MATRRAIRAPHWVWLVGAVALLGFGLVVTGLTCGPLYMLVLPPMPPAYPGATQVAAESEAHGVDWWHYYSDDHVCDVFAFYQEKAVECEYAPSAEFCAQAPREAPPGRYTEFVGRCSGQGEAFPFSWDWEFTLREVYPLEGDAYADFDITRTMHWTPQP
ncbi:MAG: hypothetical protein JXB47_15380 [Anaerolineae bacterium]|nr:hypothetical protein [Anaerolineae bacterium]